MCGTNILEEHKVSGVSVLEMHQVLVPTEFLPTLHIDIYTKLEDDNWRYTAETLTCPNVRLQGCPHERLTAEMPTCPLDCRYAHMSIRLQGCPHDHLTAEMPA